MKPKTTSKEGTTTTDRERRRNCMNTLGGDKTRSRSTFRFFKKIAPTEFFFFRKGTLFGTRNGEWGFRREGRGRVKPNFFIARGELAFLFRQTDYLAPFFIQSISPFSDTPSSTLFLAKFFVYVTSG